MPSQTLIQQGAEAKIFKIGDKIIKDRIPKAYRLKELDDKIRKRRTKAEAKLLEKAGNFVNIPKIIKIDEKEKKIIMEYVDGDKLSDKLDEFPLEKQKQVLKQIGEDVAKLHQEDIIHGDLTTSNMILVEDLPVHSHSQIDNNPVNKKQNSRDYSEVKLGEAKISNKHIKKEVMTKIGDDNLEKEVIPIIYFIDFGLGYFNGKYEDKAVDIHLLKQALEAKHFKHWKELYEEFLEGYKSINKEEAEEVINQLVKVEKRGRYKH